MPMNKLRTVLKKVNNKGFTMLELIITVAIVSIFFTAIAYVIPEALEYYLVVEKTSTALELADIIENGLEMEMGGAASLAFDESYGVTYINGEEIRTFPANKDLSNIDMQVDVDNRTVIVSGKPYVWRSVYDDELYGDYSAKIVLDQDVDTGDMRIELTIFDGDGDQLCTSRKPVIMYN